MVLDNRLKLFLVLSALFTTSLVVGDIIGGKLIELNLFGLPVNVSVGMIPFPVTFLLTDILNEFYGPRAAKLVTFTALAMAVFTFGILSLAAALPFAPITRAADWTGITEAAFNNVFTGSQRILFASFVAFIIGQLVDITVFHALKRRTANKLLWLRATGSTVASQLVDTCVIQFVAWSGILPVSKIWPLILTSYAVKLLVAIGLTPAVYAAHGVVERVLGIEPVLLPAGGKVEAQPG